MAERDRTDAPCRVVLSCGKCRVLIGDAVVLPHRAALREMAYLRCAGYDGRSQITLSRWRQIGRGTASLDQSALQGATTLSRWQ